uniref:CASP-like protein n=1 Tax=Rhizophora mucronata TaxID=61149 RepID=A0A2P2IVJ1_RHIMU
MPAVRKVGPEGATETMTSSTLRRPKREEMLKIGELGLRIGEVVLCLISFSVMAADKTQGWSGDSFDRYKEYRYCLSVNVIAFVYSSFQAYDLGYRLVAGKHVIRHHLRLHFNFFIDQALAYLLLSASSSAATQVDDWQSNWGKDKFTEMATASIAMAFLAFIAFAGSSLVAGYNLCKHDQNSTSTTLSNSG